MSMSNTFTALLNAVTTAANASAQSINTAASGLDMLDKFVAKAKEDQAFRHTIDGANYRHSYLLDAAKTITDKELQIERMLNSVEVKERFNSHFDKLAALVAPKEA
jgi:hypothetical protein